MIRRAKTSDLEHLYEMGKKLHDNFAQTNNLEKMINDENYKVLVYVQEENILGFLTVIELFDTVDIEDIYVKESFRRKHVASSLMSYLLGDVKESVELITLEVNVNNRAAIHFYEKFDFDVVHKRLFYYGDEDAYLMGRRIIR